LNKLEEYFEILKQALGLPRELKLVVKPQRGEYLGEVIGNLVYIYTEDEDEARATLLHELIDVLITSLINYAKREPEPEEIYKVKEAVVETLCRLVDDKQVLTAASTNHVVSILRKIGREDMIC